MFRLLARKVLGYGYLVASSTNIPTNAWVQIPFVQANAAVTKDTANNTVGGVAGIQPYNGTSSTILVGVGPNSGAVQAIAIVGPSGAPCDTIPVDKLMNDNTGVWVKAADTNATTGTFSCNFLGG